MWYVYLAETVWWYRSRGLSFSQICEAIWPRLKKDKNLPENIRKLAQEISKVKDDQERIKRAVTWLKGTIDNVLLNVAFLGLEDEFLKDPKKYTQAVLFDLRRKKKESENPVPEKRDLPPDPRFK